jgi:hypothetical protein
VAVLAKDRARGAVVSAVVKALPIPQAHVALTIVLHADLVKSASNLVAHRLTSLLARQVNPSAAVGSMQKNAALSRVLTVKR